MTSAIARLTTMALSVQGRFDRKDRGATAVEYGLLVGLIAVVLIVSVTLLGGTLNDLFSNVESKLPTGTSSP